MELRLYYPAGEDGMCKFDRMATYQEVYDKLKATLKAAPGTEEGAKNWKGEPICLLDELDYFSFGGMRANRDAQIPLNTHWIACYAVEGGSEGHYIHVEFIVSQDYGEATRDLAFLGKTFMGIDHALRIAGVLTKVFYY